MDICERELFYTSITLQGISCQILCNFMEAESLHIFSVPKMNLIKKNLN